MLTPMRSFTLASGFWLSSFATTSATQPVVTLFSRTSGVLPISSVTSFAIFMTGAGPPRLHDLWTFSDVYEGTKETEFAIAHTKQKLAMTCSFETVRTLHINALVPSGASMRTYLFFYQYVTQASIKLSDLNNYDLFSNYQW